MKDYNTRDILQNFEFLFSLKIIQLKGMMLIANLQWMTMSITYPVNHLRMWCLKYISEILTGIWQKDIEMVFECGLTRWK